MYNLEKKFGGSLLVMGMMIAGEAAAQTCVAPPSCASLGYDKTAAECESLAKLKCPFDESKFFCTAYTDKYGKKIAVVGDIVYKDAIADQLIPGRLPIGIVYDTSGKMMSLQQYQGNQTEACSKLVVDGASGWSVPSIEDMAIIKNHITVINETISKLPEGLKIETDKNNSTDTSRFWVTTSLPACMISGTAIGGGVTWGCSRSDFDKAYGLSRSHLLCVRNFAEGGAGESPQPSLFAGDNYKDASGNIIGVVIATNGKHGAIISSISKMLGSNSDVKVKDKAVAYCSAQTAGGFSWSLPSFEQMSSACAVKHKGYSESNRYVSTIGYYYQSLRFCDSKDNNVTSTSIYDVETFCVTNY